MTWSQAVRACELYCVDLASPRTLVEAKQMSKALRNMIKPQIPDDYWSAEDKYEFGLER